MDTKASSNSMTRLAVAALLALAAAMGVGRFAATPLLPLMQQADGLTLAQGAWMATTNYAGYLTGAMMSFVAAPSAQRAVRWGLVIVLASTAAMALTGDVHLWYLLRFIAGVASALVLVGVSGMALSILGASEQSAPLTGVAFAGVGAGSLMAGVVALLAATAGWEARTAWLLLSAVVLLVIVVSWSSWSVPSSATSAATATATTATATATATATTAAATPAAAQIPRVGGQAPPAASPATPAATPSSLGLQAWILTFAYGVFGLGYIVPATFLPAMARELIDDPLVYGWIWPVFGLAAAASTVVTTYRFRTAPPQTVFVVSLVIMAAGVVLPVVQRSVPVLLLSALAVGGTFMVATMAGLWRARRLVIGAPFRLIAAMTAAFATGQLLGPALVALGAGQADPIRLPSLVAGALLLASASVVRYSSRVAPEAGCQPAGRSRRTDDVG